LKTDDFDYILPQNLIAQFPCEKRDECRLLYLRRSTGEVSDRRFREIAPILSPGDRLVVNDTRVIPARLRCKKTSGGAVELLVTEPIDGTSWKALVRSSRPLKEGTSVTLSKEPSVAITIKKILADGTREIAVADQIKKIPMDNVLENFGELALPHYIKRPVCAGDNETYQTIFAASKGAVASPTAGLHFTGEVLEELKKRGIDISFLTLHVGIGTFRPVVVDDPRDHRMHEERYELTGETARQINDTKSRGGRIVAVGTTVVRLLEHCARNAATLGASSGTTDLLILPGHAFRAVDGMITNFHVPRSTLLMLVCAFAGRESLMAAYSHAIEKRYRFFSYGDAMLIL
jgi:S-adenosylmethionine:tRNA ribosyltransferase-isomerase